MFIERIVFQAKFGKSGELVETLKAFEPIARRQGYHKGRLYTDVIGRFDTVVWESEFEDLSQLEEARQRGFQDPEFAQWFQRIQPLVESGSREFYRLEHSSS